MCADSSIKTVPPPPKPPTKVQKQLVPKPQVPELTAEMVNQLEIK